MRQSSSGITTVLYGLTLGAVSFYSGFRPWLFGSTPGHLLLALTALSPALLMWSLRSEKVSWRGTFSIVAFVTFIIITLVYVPTWLAFSYSRGAAGF